jgi:hypothetical protein
MLLMNKSSKQLQRTGSRVLLCVLPSGVDTLDALEHIAVKPLRKLEKGIRIYFKDGGESVRCYGSLYQFNGDHPAQAEVASMHPPLPLIYHLY